MNKFFLIAILLCCTQLFAQVTLVKDLNLEPAEIRPNFDNSNIFTKVGGLLYFTVNDELGNELWRTDGTTEGTFRVVDLQPGYKNGFLGGAALGEQFFVSTLNPKGELSIIKTSGDVGEYEVVKVFSSVTPANQSILFLDVLDSQLFFLRMTGTNGELWATDGTTGGTTYVSSFLVNGLPILSKATSELLFLQFYKGVTTDLWRTDGTAEGTIFLREIEYTSAPLTVLEEKVYLWSGLNSNEVWVSDGSVSGTVKLIELFSPISQIYPFTDRLIIVGINEWWSSDGTEGGTISLGISLPNAYSSCIMNGKFYGYGYNAGLGQTLMVETDGTPEGTRSIFTIDGAFSQLNTSGAIPLLQDKMLVRYFTEASGLELGISDGTDDGTLLLKDIREGEATSNPASFSVLNNKVFFLASDGQHGREIWVSDGTAEGTHLFKDARPGTGDALTVPGVGIGLLNTEGHIFYSGSTSSSDLLSADIWQTDGTSEGTSLSVDFPTSLVTYIGSAGGNYYFWMNGKIVKAPSLQGPLVIVKDVSAEVSGFGSVTGGITLGDKVLFYLRGNGGGSTVYGTEPWITDGTSEGTFMIKDINPGLPSSLGPLQGIALDNVALFAATEGTNGTELWSTDGTPDNTFFVRDINNGTMGSQPSEFTALDGKFYFFADDGIHGKELWQSDGTAEGTTMVFESVPGTENSTTLLTRAGENLFFIAKGPATGWELWRSDGTETGSKKIAEFLASTSTPKNLTAIGDQLYFSATTAEHGEEVWVSDGTAEGTAVVDIVQGPVGSYPYLFFDVNGIAYFTAVGQLWKSHGTAVKEMIANYEPTQLAINDGFIYFTARSQQFGHELFKMPITKFTQSIVFEIPFISVDDGSVVLNPTSSSGLPIRISTNSDKVLIDGQTLTILQAGRVTLIMNQDGNDLFGSTESQFTFCVNPSKPSINLSPDGATLTSSATEGNQWFRNNVELTDQTGQSIEVTITGTYSVRVSAEGCESSMSEDLDVTITGIKDTEEFLHIYPNPTKDEIHVEWGGPQQESIELILLNTMGQTIINRSLSSPGSISVQSLKPDVYFLKVSSANGVAWRKIVKQ